MGKRKPRTPPTPKLAPAPICPYCQQPATLYENSSILYASRKDYGPMWACLPCSAWVGVHPGPKRTPLGRLADKELREAKIKAHAAFDPLWRRKMERDGVSYGDARRAAYQWLAGQMTLEATETNIGMFNVKQCQRVVAVCAPYHKPKERAA